MPRVIIKYSFTNMDYFMALGACHALSTGLQGRGIQFNL